VLEPSCGTRSRTSPGGALTASTLHPTENPVWCSHLLLMWTTLARGRPHWWTASASRHARLGAAAVILYVLMILVGRCRLPASKSVLNAPMVSVLETAISETAFNCCFQFRLAPLHPGLDKRPSAWRQGMAVQVDPIKPTLTAPGTELLKSKSDESPSKFAFKFNLRRYVKVRELKRWQGLTPARG